MNLILTGKKGKQVAGFAIVAVAIMAAVCFGGAVAEGRTVRAGLYENKPKIFTDEQGKPAGLFIDILNEIAKREQWTIEYTRCEWPDCLTALEEGRIDLMPDVAYSAERDEKYDFHDKPVAESWSQVYANPDVPIAMFSDLNGRRVALLEGSIQEKALAQTLSGFGYSVTVVPARTFAEAFGMVKDGRADVAITNRFFGDYFYREYGLAKTTIIFDVVTLRFAVANGRNGDLLKKIDSNLSEWFAEPYSPYYKSLAAWMEKPPQKALPGYVIYSAVAAGIVMALAAWAIFILRGQLARQMKLESQLLESREKYKGIFDESVAAIFVFDEKKNFIDANQAGLDLLGYSREELLGMNRSDIDADTAEDAPAREQLMSGKRLENYEIRLKKKNGEILETLNNSRPIEDEDGNVVGMLSTLIDITERKKIEEEKKKIEQQLLQSQKMEAIGQLAGGVAHDFNNITATISGTAEILLRQAPPDSPTADKLKRIFNSCMRAKDLTMKLLSFARKEKLNVRTMSAGDIVKDVVGMLKSAAPAKIRISVEIGEVAQKIMVDGNQIIQALLNICLNGCDAMPGGGELNIKVGGTLVDNETAAIRAVESGEFAVISVEDSGSGIDDENLDKLFEPFFTTKDKGKGSGLGLSISHGIVSAHGGFIDVRTKKGEGTVFSVYLPAASPGDTAKGEEELKQEEESTRGKVLVVDDDLEYAEMITEAMEHDGFEVVAATSGREAVSIYKEKFRQIEVVLLDMLLPEMDGTKIFHALKNINPKVKVVLCSGYSVEGDATDLLQKGAVAYVQKPFELSNLVSVVAKAMNENAPVV